MCDATFSQPHSRWPPQLFNSKGLLSYSEWGKVYVVVAESRPQLTIWALPRLVRCGCGGHLEFSLPWKAAGHVPSRIIRPFTSLGFPSSSRTFLWINNSPDALQVFQFSLQASAAFSTQFLSLYPRPTNRLDIKMNSGEFCWRVNETF